MPEISEREGCMQGVVGEPVAWSPCAPRKGPGGEKKPPDHEITTVMKEGGSHSPHRGF